MKKFFVFVAIFLLFTNKGLYAQRLNDSLVQLNKAELSHYYENKATHQKTTAIVAASGGAALSVIGLCLIISNTNTNVGNALVTLFTLTPPPPNPHKNRGVAVAVIGLSAVVASIPFAVASMHNRKKAVLMLQNQTTFIAPHFSIKQPGISLIIPLGR